jgi:type II secretory pathway predicted ATPase ExeA
MVEAAILENQSSFNLSALSRNPFDPAAQPSYPYLSSSFREALAALYYGLEYGSRILLLTADRGLGKTTLLRHFEDRMRGRTRTLLLSPGRDREIEVLRKLLAHTGSIDAGDELRTIQTQVDEILTRIAAADTPFILLLDYDENAAESAPEILHCLTSLESFERRLLRLVLAGPPDIAERLQGSVLADDVRRVPLAPLTAAEVESYIDYRLRWAGWRGSHPFTAQTCELIAAKSSGSLFAINEICDNLLQNPAEPPKSPSDSAGRNQDALSNEPEVTPAAHGRRASAPAMAKVSSRRSVVLVSVALVLLLGGGLWYQVPIKARIRERVSAEVAAPLAVILHYYSGIHSGHPQARQIPSPAVPEASATSKSLAYHHATAAVSEPAGAGETARLSSLASPIASPAAPPVLSATSGRTNVVNSTAVSPANAVPSAISSPPAAGMLPNSGAQPPAMVATKDQNNISAPLSRMNVPAPLSASSFTPQPALQQAPATSPAAIPTIIPTAKETRAARVANAVAAYEIRLGDAYMNAGQYNYALSSFSRAIAYSPGNKEAEEKLERARRAKATEANILH